MCVCVCLFNLSFAHESRHRQSYLCIFVIYLLNFKEENLTKNEQIINLSIRTSSSSVFSFQCSKVSSLLTMNIINFIYKKFNISQLNTMKKEINKIDLLSLLSNLLWLPKILCRLWRHVVNFVLLSNSFDWIFNTWEWVERE